MRWTVAMWACKAAPRINDPAAAGDDDHAAKHERLQPPPPPPPLPLALPREVMVMGDDEPCTRHKANDAVSHVNSVITGNEVKIRL